MAPVDVAALVPRRLPVVGSCRCCPPVVLIDREGLVEVHTYRGRECVGGRLTPAEVRRG